VRTGKLTPSEFVAVTSANTAKIFNMYPQKGTIAVGSDADIVVWDPQKRRTLSKKTQHSNIDINIYEGMETIGNPAVTLSRGKIVWQNDMLSVERGWGKYVDRPCNAPYWSAIRKANELAEPTAVKR
jgi:dihydropyrimidinase